MNTRVIKQNKNSLSKWYNKKGSKVAPKYRGDNSMAGFDNNVSNWIGWTVGTISIIGSLAGLISWFRNRRERKMKERTAILDGIDRLCRGQDELYERMDEMDKLRNMARIEDAQVRANLYLGQIAVIGAILELSEKTGIHINGEIREYYRQNQDYLRNGVGMAPLHSVHKSKDRPKEK